jgi:peroxiredoxin
VVGHRAGELLLEQADSHFGLRRRAKRSAIAGQLAQVVIVGAQREPHRDVTRVGRDCARWQGKRPRRPQRRGPSGLPKGSPAPEFRLPDVRGGDVALAKHLDAGHAVVVAFVSPQCGPCKSLLPDLARWQRTVSETVAVLIVSDGEMEPNIALADETGLDSLLVARQTRVRAQYDVTATPSAVLVDRDGTIATAAAVGAPAIEALVRIALRRHRATPLAMAPAHALTEAASSA